MYNVLISDDEPLMRRALEIMISKVKDFEVKYSVGNGEQAVAICKNNKIDIVFMDIMMPGESGIECSKKIHENNSRTTIFIVSAYNSFDFAIKALQTNVKAYLSKPVSFSQIETLLNNYRNENIKDNDGNSCMDEVKKICTIIKEKDFRKVYCEIPKIADEIYSLFHNDLSILENVFINIGQQIINSKELLDCQCKKVEEFFPINEIFIKERRYFEFWMFKLVDYVFKENSIKKYNVLENVFKYIENHIKDEIGLNEIINNCSLSQGYLSRIFKRQFNISVMEYLHMRKINIAKEYICFTDLSVTDIAFKLGYNESSYFSKVFKKYEKVTIYQYKKKR